MHTPIRWLAAGLSLSVVLGCQPGQEAEPTDGGKASSDMPPGFLDAPPAAPTSNTLVLSGGTLLSEPELADSVVVITDGRLVAWGGRGKVDMPNDSIGRDMRGTWLRPDDELSEGRPAQLSVFTRNPADLTEVAACGYVKGTDVDLQDCDPDK